MKKILLIGIIGMSLMFNGCHRRPNIKQQKEMTTRIFSGDYNKIFIATLLAFQDSGYSIDTSDKDTGVIRGISNVASGETSKVFQRVLFGKANTTRSVFKGNAIIIKQGDKSKINLIISKIKFGDGGGLFRSGEVQKSSEKVLDKRVYDAMFKKIKQNI